MVRALKSSPKRAVFVRFRATKKVLAPKFKTSHHEPQRRPRTTSSLSLHSTSQSASGPLLKMSQTNGLVRAPGVPSQCLILTDLPPDKTCLFENMAPHLSQHSTPRLINNSASARTQLTSPPTPLPRAPRLPHRRPANGQTQTNLGSLDRLRRLRRGHQLLGPAHHRQKALAETILQT